MIVKKIRAMQSPDLYRYPKPNKFMTPGKMWEYVNTENDEITVSRWRRQLLSRLRRV